MISEIIYVSRAREDLGEQDFTDILNSARSFNESVGITGILLYRERTFLQVIEGDQPALDSLYEKIFEDPRHSAVRTLVYRQKKMRHFSHWSMGFSDLGQYQINFETSDLDRNFAFPDESTVEQLSEQIKPANAQSLIAHFASFA